MRIVLVSLLVSSGCFGQLGLGAQRSPDGTVVASGQMIGGVHVEIGSRSSAGVAAQGVIAGYSNEGGGGYSVGGPVAVVAHVRAVMSAPHAMAVVGELGVPYGSSIHYETDAGDERDIAEESSTRVLLGLSYHYIDEQATFRTNLGVESFFVRGAAPFDDIVTLGLGASVGFTMTASQLGRLVDRLLDTDGNSI